tara:strand:+ start:3564 stop:4421 length:858 start_codon:yes stop_codon:yes gene_type:complete
MTKDDMRQLAEYRKRNDAEELRLAQAEYRKRNDAEELSLALKGKIPLADVKAAYTGMLSPNQPAYTAPKRMNVDDLVSNPIKTEALTEQAEYRTRNDAEELRLSQDGKIPIRPAYDNILKLLQDKKKLTDEEIARLDASLRRVAHVESKGDATAHQLGGGPGRGLFQFENASGSGSSATAAVRVKTFEKLYGPLGLTTADTKELNKDNPDFSKISADGQKAITLANWTIKTSGDTVGDLARGTIPLKDFWIKHHWAGKEKDVDQKGRQWDREMKAYERMVGRQNA